MTAPRLRAVVLALVAVLAAVAEFAPAAAPLAALLRDNAELLIGVLAAVWAVVANRRAAKEASREAN